MGISETFLHLYRPKDAKLSAEYAVDNITLRVRHRDGGYGGAAIFFHASLRQQVEALAAAHEALYVPEAPGNDDDCPF